MTNQQFNSLVVSYQQSGDEMILNEIFRVINPLIERTSTELERLTTDATKFDCRIILKVKRLLEGKDGEIRDFLSVIKTLISKEKADFIRRRSRKLDEVSMEFLAEDSDEQPGYQFADTLASVEDEVMLKEKIALLAQGDKRKSVIIEQWCKGASDDRSISVVLAHRFGGKPESHRKFITRFKSECRDRLLADASHLTM